MPHHETSWPTWGPHGGLHHLPLARGRCGGSEASAVSWPAYTCHQPHRGGGGLAGEGCCVQAAADHPAGPSVCGGGVPPPPLSRGGEVAGSMAGRGHLSTGGEREEARSSHQRG
jgi:hypothetical protein